MLQRIYNKFRRVTSSRLYLPEIDGLRFLAITLVVFYHLHIVYRPTANIHFAGDPQNYQWLRTILTNGRYGVEIFFVISGFILCYPFALHYLKGEKKVALKAYYLRRLTRLEPPYFIALFVLFILQLALHTMPSAAVIKSWLLSLIYANNLTGKMGVIYDPVTWSLEIEIQFYLLAPLLFRVLALNAIKRRSVLIGATILMTCLQTVYEPPFLCIYQFAQYFFMGVLLADFYISDVASGFFNKKPAILLAAVCIATILLLPRNSNRILFFTFILRLFLPLLAGLFMYVVLKNKTLKKIFSFKLITLVGGMCYSIYLLHYPLIKHLHKFTFFVHFTPYYLVNLVLQMCLLGIPVLLICSVFYYYVERPFMSRKWLEILMKKSGKE